MIYISIFLLVSAIVICVKGLGGWIRIVYSASVVAWSMFVLTIYINLLPRLAVNLEGGHGLASTPFVSGVLAFRESLTEGRICLGLSVLSLALLAVFTPVKR